MPPTLAAPCFIVSDAHLGAAPPEVEETLLAFLDRARADARSVVLNGDVFDFWFEWRHVMPRAGFRTLAALSALRDAGVDVLWIAGNHDCWGGDILRHDVGVDYRVGPWRGTIAGWDTLIEHGDGLREVEDKPYRRLRAVLRHPVSVWAFRHLLHPDWATWLAKRSSHTSRNMRPRDEGEGLKRVAQERLAADSSLDLYVYGHSHAQALERTRTGEVYANPGAWMDGPTALRVTNDRVELVSVGADAVRVLKSYATKGR